MNTLVFVFVKSMTNNKNLMPLFNCEEHLISVDKIVVHTTKITLTVYLVDIHDIIDWNLCNAYTYSWFAQSSIF